MKAQTTLRAAIFGAFLVTSTLTAQELRPLEDLGQWSYDPASWELKDGMAVGKTSDDVPLPYNKFLIWNGGELADFVLSVKMKVTGQNNSGIQYRSKRRDDLGEFVISGYQCDAHPSNDYCSMLYEEKGRGILATRGQKIVIGADGKKTEAGKVGKPAKVDLAQWNTYEIRAEGNRLIHKLNGIQTVEVIDLQAEKRALSGLLAFQIHRGPAMEVQIKDLVIKPLKSGKILTAAD